MVSATTDRRQGLTGDKGIKAPVKAATTANITLSGEQTIDGVGVVALDRVLVKNQTNAIQNGIYDVSTGAWTRSIDANGTQDLVKGTLVLVTDGAQAQTTFEITSANPVIPDSSSIVFSAAFASSAAISAQEWPLFGGTPTYISATQFSVTGDQTPTFLVNRRIKASVTAGTIYGTVTASAFSGVTTVTVGWDSTQLDSGLSAVNAGFLSPAISSTPFTSYAFAFTSPPTPMILNGDMSIDQFNEGGFYTSTASEVYSLDGYRFVGNSAAVFTIKRNSVNFPVGFQYSLQAQVATHKNSAGATDNDHIEIPIEGPRIRALKWGTAQAQPLTVQFQVLSGSTGTYSFAVMNGINTISYVTTFSIPVINVWTPITIKIPGPTTGTWDTSIGVFGLKIIFDLGTGSTYEAPSLNQWNNVAAWRATGSTRLTMLADSTLILYAALQEDIGYSPLPYRYLDPDHHLRLMQRYFWKTIPQGHAVISGAGSIGSLMYCAMIANTVVGGGVWVQHPVEMMASPPTYLTYNPITGSGNAKWYNLSTAADSGVPAVFAAGSGACFVSNPQIVGDTAGSVIELHITANARLGGS